MGVVTTADEHTSTTDRESIASESSAGGSSGEATDLGFDFSHSFAGVLPELVHEWDAAQVPAPELLAFNQPLADELGLDAERLSSPSGVNVLVGNASATGSRPAAMIYAGHQFGGYSPRLGDGRALLLGEILDPAGQRYDIHLKGSGRTPMARGGDGKSELAPMLREYLIAEAMHALGVPTGRALAVVGTGEQVRRQTGMMPGAVLTRVATSHIRVGTFEYAARLEDASVLRRLADHTIARHYPSAVGGGDNGNPYLALLSAVAEEQASLIARWMLVGFIHGVMNTDNMTVSGETIDYGPCAFIDRFDPATVYSSIDRDGRYAYGNQPSIALWNLSRLAETLLPLIGEAIDGAPDRVDALPENSESEGGPSEESVAVATAALEAFPDRFRFYWVNLFRAKVGLAANDDPGDELLAADGQLGSDLLDLLHQNQVDFTSSFRALADVLRGDESRLGDLFEDRSAIDPWLDQWRSRVISESGDLASVADGMDAVNPLFIPRNHLVDEALEAATAGDMSLFDRLYQLVTNPYESLAPDDVDFDPELYTRPAPDGFDRTFRTFCGT